MKQFFSVEEASQALDSCTLDIAFYNFDATALELRFRGLKVCFLVLRLLFY